jgi:hypothetical protein
LCFVPLLEPGRKRRRRPTARLTFWLWIVAGWLLVLIVAGALLR